MAKKYLTKQDVLSLIARAYGSLPGTIARRLTTHARFFSYEAIINSLPSHERLLDVGCGDGLLGIMAQQNGICQSVLGFDPSPEKIATAQAAAAAVGDQAKLQFETRSPGSWPSGHYDVVMCVNVLHHIPAADQTAFLNRLTCAVTSGGRLVIVDVSTKPRWKNLIDRIEHIIARSSWTRYRPEHSVVAYLKKQGLHVEPPKRLTSWWLSHYIISADRTGS